MKKKRTIWKKKNAMDLGLDYYEKSSKLWESKKNIRNLCFILVQLYILSKI